jgi:hypothetical protein
MLGKEYFEGKRLEYLYRILEETTPLKLKHILYLEKILAGVSEMLDHMQDLDQDVMIYYHDLLDAIEQRFLQSQRARAEEEKSNVVWLDFSQKK